MELVYLWVEDYKNIYNQGFNFSPRFECKFHDEYDEDGKLKDNCKLDIFDKKKNECKDNNYIENFFGENINVTAIVGKNGSGKSAVLEILTSSLSESSEKQEIFSTDKSKFFLIYQYGGAYYSLKVNLSSSLKITNRKYKITDIEPDRLFSKNENLIAILLNNESIVKKNYVENGEQLFVANTQFHINQIEKTIASNYIEERNKSFSKDTDKFFIPTKIEIHSKYSNEINGNITSSLKEFSMKKTQENIKLLEDAFSKSSNSLLESIEKSPTSLLHTFELKDLNNDKLKDIFLLKSELIDIKICNDTKSFKDLSYGERQLLTNLNFILFYSKQEKYPRSEKSPDEETGKVYESKDRIKVNNILVLLDEFELGLHPDWQKKSIKYIIDFLKNINKNFHFIITSHSPFLLSDIPKQNIIFLDKDEKGNCRVVNGLKEKKQTFGANIHTLLSDSFFMEDGLMGEFAKGKIDEVIKLLNKEKLDEKELKYCEQIISIVGEPIVKNQLQRMLDSKRLKKVDKIDAIEKDIKALQEELAKLKK